MKILSNKKYNDLVLKSCKGMFGAVTDDQLLRENALLSKENQQLKEDKKKAIEKIKSVRTFGLRSGKTLIATLLNDILEILGDDNG